MGWWSCTVMGGDTPMDFNADLIETAGVDYEYFQDELKFDLTSIKDDLHRRLNEMIMYCEGHHFDDRNIAFQVLGSVLMEAGVLIPDSVKKKIITGAREDEWALEDSERKQYMNAFIAQVEVYDGTPTEIAYEGLFDKFAELLGENK